MIDLANAREPARKLIAVSLESFRVEHPEVSWSMFALYACPWSGWVMTCFDTEENSARLVEEYADSGPAWYGEDEFGRFNDNCPDFAFVEWRQLEFDDWSEEYEGGEPFRLRDLQGREHVIDVMEAGDEALNRPVFEFLRSLLREEQRSASQSWPSVQDGRRIGVQLLDSEYAEFWPAKSQQGG